MASKHESKASAQETAENIARKAVEKLNDNVKQMASFGRETLDAVVQSSTAAGKNAESIFTEVVAFSKQNIENSVGAVKEIASVRSPEALSTLQSRYAQQSFETYVSQMTRLSELFMSATKEVSEPISARFNALSEIIGSKKVA